MLQPNVLTVTHNHETNLTTFRDWLVEHKEQLKDHINMDYYCSTKDRDYLDKVAPLEVYNECDTSACGVGWAAHAFDGAFSDYSEVEQIIFGTIGEVSGSMWELLFAPSWPDNLDDLLERINWALDNWDRANLNTDGFSQDVIAEFQDSQGVFS